MRTANHSDYRVYFGNSSNLDELNDGEISLAVSSPPYYNAPFDYPGLFSSYDDYLELLQVPQEIVGVSF